MNPPSSTTQQESSARQAGLDADLPARNAADWDDEDPLPRRLTAQEAEAFRDKRTAPSPWRVVLVQVEAGAVILPAMPAFYTKPQSLQDVVDFVVGRICDQLGVAHQLHQRWGQSERLPLYDIG